MKTSLAPRPNRFQKLSDSPRPSAPVTDYAYQSPAPVASTQSSASQKARAELTNFRALSRGFFGGEAGREYVREAIVFAGMMVIAAWPLGVTFNMLSTMMISPPPWMVDGTMRFIG